MLEKGFLKNQPEEKLKHQRIASIASKVLLYLGELILVSAFIYLFFNFKKSDLYVGLIMPFLVAGLGLIFVSYLIKRAFSKIKR